MNEDFKAFLENELKNYPVDITLKEVGEVVAIDKGICQIRGLRKVKSAELLTFHLQKRGIVFNVEEDEIGAVLLDKEEGIQAGSLVQRTNLVMSTPVGEELLGRVIDPVGRVLDGGEEISFKELLPIERPAPPLMDRLPVTEPLYTGIQIIDSMIPIGKGQRELILGDRQTGKSTIAIDTIINQKGRDVICIYCSIGQRSSSVMKIISEFKNRGALAYTILVIATGEDPPGVNFIAPYAATSIGEYFRDKGKDVLIVYDDLTHHANSYRELSLLLRRPPTREAYPGDIFYIHSRLLERSAHLNKNRGGGSLTALPIIETEAQNVSAYIPTNLISITDGQIYLSPKLFQEGVLPAIDFSTSVSRVGGKAQIANYRHVVGDLRLIYSQLDELEMFSRFGTRLDEKTAKTLDKCYRIQEIFKQKEHELISPQAQIAILFSLNQGLFDNIPLDQIGKYKAKIANNLEQESPELFKKILSDENLFKQDLKKIKAQLTKIYANP